LQVNREERAEAQVAGNIQEFEGAPVGLAEERQVMSKSHPFGDDRLLTVGEVAGTMRVSNMTVYRLIKSGQLPAFRVGKNYRIRESDVSRYLTEQSVHVEEM
jgi:excisionase family DNA binding protein